MERDKETEIKHASPFKGLFKRRRMYFLKLLCNNTLSITNCTSFDINSNN